MPRYKKPGRPKDYAKRRAIAKEMRSSIYFPQSNIAKAYKTSKRLVSEVAKTLRKLKY